MTRLLIPALALLLAACGGDADRDADRQDGLETVDTAAPQRVAEVPVDAALAADLLARIDAETAKLWLSLEPMPEALLDQIWSAIAGMEDQMDQDFAEMAENIDDPLVQSLWKELGQLTSPEGYAERGIDPNGMAAIHMMAIYPVFHWQLSDAEAFAAMLARVESEAETPFTRRSIGDEELIWIDMDRFGLALHHDQHFMTAGLVADREDLLRRVANLDQAPNPLQRAQVDAFARQRGLRQDSFGFVDFDRLLAVLLDGEDELLVQVRADTPLGQVAEDAACRRELGQLVRLFPRKSYGNTDVTASSISMKLTVESEPEFGRRMSALADSPLSLAGDRSALMSLGVALNLVAARDFGRQVVGGWVEAPPRCFLFDNIAENAAQWQLALNRPIPPVVTNIHGVRMRVTALDMNDTENPGMGTVALFMRNPQMLIGMAQMFSPELAALDLRPGGAPQPVPSDMIPQLAGVPAWLGLSETGLGLAVGEGQDSALPAALTAGSADSAILSFGMDVAAYAEVIAMSLANLPGQAADFDAAETAEAMAVLSSFYRYMASSLHLSESGIEVRLTMDLAD